MLSSFSVLSSLFHEELGFVLEVRPDDLASVEEVLNKMDVKYLHLGLSLREQVCQVIGVDSMKRTGISGDRGGQHFEGSLSRLAGRE